MKIEKSGTVFLATVVLLLLFTVSAMAQQKKANPMNVSQEFNIEPGSLEKALDANSKTTVKQTRRETKLENIKVTAQKQEENVQDVAISMSVFNELDIEDRKIESVLDIADFVPNLMIYQHGASGMNTPTMRGISANIESLKVASGLYVDGVSITNSIGYEVEILDVERIEVLRGPQGTIYGSGAETGAINIISRLPDNEFRGKVSAEGGKLLSSETDDRLAGALSFNISGPVLTDQLFFSVAGKYYQKGGFIENTLTGNPEDDREHWYGKVHLRWTPTDKADISLIASRLEYDDDALSMGLGENGAAAFGLPLSLSRQVSSNLEGGNKSNSNALSLKIDYDISDSLTLTSVTANSRYNENLLQDWDFSPTTIFHNDKTNQYDNLSQELRLNYSKERLKWLLGFYYDNYHTDADWVTSSIFPGFGGTTNRDYDGDTYAVFANLTYPLTTELSLITGLRYETESQEFKDNVLNLHDEDSWNSVSPKIGLEYRFKPEIMAYVNLSKGYRSGGYNITATNPQYYSYDKENLWSYEIGFKSIFFDNRILINGSIYYMDITDMQVDTAVSPVENFVTNAAEATGKGIELELTARVTDSLSFMAGYGYNDTEFDKFSDALGDYEGNQNPFSPEYTFNLVAQYRHAGGFYARADLIGYGQIYFDKANEYSRDAYEIVNAKVGYEAENFDVYLYAKNLFDKEYDSDGYFSGFYTIYSDPGEAGLQLVYRF